MEEEVRREVELDCDPERAWQALTDEEELGAWLGGEVEADLKPGGEILVREEDGTERSGFFETVDPDGISFWWSEQEGESSRVEFGVTPAETGQGCVVTVVETRPMVELERELADITSCALA